MPTRAMLSLNLRNFVIACIFSMLGNTASANFDGFPEILYSRPALSIITEIDKDGNEYNPVEVLVESTLTEAGLKWKARRYPIPRLYSSLYENLSNFTVTILTPKTELCCIRSRNPIFNLELRVYHNPERAPALQSSDLKGKDIITINTYSYGTLGEFLANKENDIRIHPADSHESAFDMLAANRGDYFLDYKGPAKKVSKEIETRDIRYTVLRKIELYLILRKDYPKAREVMTELESIYKRKSNDTR